MTIGSTQLCPLTITKQAVTIRHPLLPHPFWKRVKFQPPPTRHPPIFGACLPKPLHGVLLTRTSNSVQHKMKLPLFFQRKNLWPHIIQPAWKLSEKQTLRRLWECLPLPTYGREYHERSPYWLKVYHCEARASNGWSREGHYGSSYKHHGNAQ